MADTKTIKSKLKTVGNIKKITRAMEMVARSKMKKSIDKAMAVRPFAYFGLEFLVNFSYHSKVQSVFYTKSEGTRTLIVEVSANKGLCGGYNGNMFRELRRYISENNLKDIDFVAVGKYATHHATLLGGKTISSITNLTENVTLDDAEKIAGIIKKAYESGVYGTVLFAYTNFVSTLSQKPNVFQLLPVSAEIYKNQLASDGDVVNRMEVTNADLKRDWSIYLVEPSKDVILDVIIPKLVTSQVYQSLLDATASEQASRMIAMKNATENADDLEKGLELEYNHIRQEGITRELAEIVAGTL
jgi:F-type H+-transporting ATPase subunit gamma